MPAPYSPASDTRTGSSTTRRDRISTRCGRSATRSPFASRNSSTTSLRIVDRPDLIRRAAAEGLAAFALVFAGCGAIVADAQYDGTLGTVGIALVFGLIIMVMVYATGHLSGAHINPAVTIAFTLSRHFPARDAAAYVVAQLIGATAGALGLLAV